MQTPNIVQAPKVMVAVDPAMQKLRETQTFLNHFLWTTEIAYRFFLEHRDVKALNPQRLASDAFGSLAAEAWFLNRQGATKFPESVETTIAQTQMNLPYIHRAVIILFFVAFEEYLGLRLGKPPQLPRRNVTHRIESGWGPYYLKLPFCLLHHTRKTIKPTTLLCADICRRVRNAIVHPKHTTLPSSTGDALALEWRSKIERDLLETNFPPREHQKHLDNAFNQVIGNAEKEIRQAQGVGKMLPTEFLYALFTFTNLNLLAYKIEEALIPLSAGQPKGQVRMAPKDVDRPDLIIVNAPVT